MNGVDEADLVVGVDTHLDTHTAAICDARGRVVSQLQVPATTAGYVQVLAWARQAAGTGAVAWAVEGTRHYGLGLARHLTAQGERVAEIDCSRHIGKRRAGKSDPIDAVRAARELLARPAPAQMRADGDREALRLLMIDRDNAVQSAKTARSALAAVLVIAPAPPRADPSSSAGAAGESMRRADLPRHCRPADPGPAPGTHPPRPADRRPRWHCSRARGADHRDRRGHGSRPGHRRVRPGLPVRRADPAVLVPRRADPHRTGLRDALRNRAGSRILRTHRRHRLNRLGDRRLNRAIHTIAVTRMRCHPDTRAYVERRRAEGKTDREIRRCIKRYLARHLYRTLNQGIPSSA